MKRPVLRTSASAAVLLTLLAAAGCSGDDSSAEGAEAAPDGDAASALTVEDPWVKSAESGMTAAFGTLVNTGDDDLVVTGVSSEVSPAMELHETVQNDDGSMAMQQKDGGFVVPAGGEHELTPGGDHLMFMDLERSVEAGEEVDLVLTFDDGSEATVTATAKPFDGADEQYQRDGGGDMDMGGEGR